MPVSSAQIGIFEEIRLGRESYITRLDSGNAVIELKLDIHSLHYG